MVVLRVAGELLQDFSLTQRVGGLASATEYVFDAFDSYIQVILAISCLQDLTEAAFSEVAQEFISLANMLEGW
jgi:hypothetical protein